MRPWPRSLFGRLLAISTLTTIAALAFAAVSIGHVLERFVIRGLDQQLDAQAGMLAKAVRADGTLDRRRIVNLPVFETSAQGWGWRVEGARGDWAGGDPIDPASMSVRHGPPHRRPGGREEDGDRPRPGDGITLSGAHVHYRALAVPTAWGEVTAIASGPRRLAIAPLREAMVPLMLSLALLGLGLGLGTFLQLRFGLRPLRTLRVALADVRAGRTRHIPLDQPAELVPLATELNALIDQNEAGLAHARRHVSNLAHGIKTPLASLGVKLAETGRDPDGSLSEIVAQIDRRVRHHLGRARALAPGGVSRARTRLAPAVADLIVALGRIYAERGITPAIDIAPGLVVAVDAQDLDEMVGNLLDNGWRHARSTVTIAAVAIGAAVRLTIDDDGPGLPDAAMAEALVPGRRLDEQGDGYGFGLSITEELAGLNGGQLAIGASPLASGLRATLTLPAGI